MVRKAKMLQIDARTFSRYFKAFGEPTRLKILSLLADGEMTVNEITEAVGLSQPTVSRHLAQLRDADIVIDRRDGQRIFYSLNKDVISECCNGFCDCLRVVQITPEKKSRKK